jgi:hypothetical protein
VDGFDVLLVRVATDDGLVGGARRSGTASRRPPRSPSTNWWRRW